MMTLPLEETPAGAAEPRALSRILNFMEARRVTALALGPGLSTDPRTVRLVKALLSSSPAPAVVDADALNALARGGWPGARRSPWVLTPHPGELARLAKKTPREVQSRRAESARRLSARRGVVCVLKGRGTVVTDGRRTWVNATGNPAMATGGMGDVLAGLIAGLAGQTAGDGTEEKLFRAAVAGVYIHGLAGDLAAKSLGPAGLLAGDVLAFLPRAFKKVYR
jgi:NAD(P)H-hydrate epimerase